MKLSFWDILAVLALLATAGIGMLYAVLFVNPGMTFNPFPPPSQPTELVLPTSTSTLRSLPETWTPTGGAPTESGLRPSSTPMPSGTVQVIPSMTATNTRTVTLTPTRTKTTTGVVKTYTPTITRTLTKTPKKSPTRTQTKTSGPYPNPASASETHGAASNTWQKAVADPKFTWSAQSGAKGYYVYFGTSSSGTATKLVTSASYDPAAVSTGTYYLRLSTKFSGGNAPWVTLFIFRYDNTAPSAPVSASASGALNDVWQNSAARPTFTWSGAVDTGSGINSYNIYFGPLNGGTTVVATSGGASWQPASSVTDGTYYLTLQAVDAVGNTSPWASLFTLRYDGSAPTTPNGVTVTGVLTTTNRTPTFTWNASVDTRSGLGSNYDIYWGPGSGTPSAPTGTTNGLVTTYTVPALPKGTSGTYYLRVRAKDRAGNVSGWSSAYAYSYNIPP